MRAPAKRPAHPAGDIRLDVALGAPLLVRDRRGDGVSAAVAAVTAPATIRTVPFSAFRGVRLTAADDRFEDVIEFEGRFWRRAAPDHPLDAVLDALRTRAPASRIRLDLDDLWLDPFVVEPSSGRVTGTVDAIAEADRPRIALDLSDRTVSTASARFARDVVHAAGGLWIARDPPMLGYSLDHLLLERKLAEDRVADSRRNHHYLRESLAVDRRWMPRSLVSAADDHDRYLARLAKRRHQDRREVLAAAVRLAPQLEGREPPLADVAAFVRFQSPQLVAATETVLRYKRDDGLRLGGPAGDEAKARLARVRAIAALASADLVEEREIPAAIDAMQALATIARANAPRTGSYAIGVLDTVLAYLDEVVRPRLALQPQAREDAEALSGLAL